MDLIAFMILAPIDLELMHQLQQIHYIPTNVHDRLRGRKDLIHGLSILHELVIDIHFVVLYDQSL